MALLLLYSPQTQTWNWMCFLFFKISLLISSVKKLSICGFVCHVKPVIHWPPALTQLINDCATSMSILSVDHTGTFTTISNTECLLCSVETLGEMPATQKLTDISWGSALTYRASNLALYRKIHIPKKRRLHLCGWWPLREWTREALPFWHGAHILEIRERKQLWEPLNDLKMCGKEFGNRLNPGQRVAVMSPSLIFISLPPFSTSLPDHTVLRVCLTSIAQLFGLLKCCICHCGLFL